jgi:hypothetical protein
MPALPTAPARSQPITQSAPEQPPATAAPPPASDEYAGDRIALSLWVACALPLAWLLLKDLALALFGW